MLVVELTSLKRTYSMSILCQNVERESGIPWSNGGVVEICIESSRKKASLFGTQVLTILRKKDKRTAESQNTTSITMKTSEEPIGQCENTLTFPEEPGKRPELSRSFQGASAVTKVIPLPWTVRVKTKCVFRENPSLGKAEAGKPYELASSSICLPTSPFFSKMGIITVPASQGGRGRTPWDPVDDCPGTQQSLG